ncbi:MbtH family NRPS accessory protein [Paenibacillus sp. HB172176]|uniref:MbtH family protein n=1 Tax=Paenibacillus sp. HB172176 TaxID=2493690 RepID=UPI00143884A8|nr:MbtH family NRPS accessory protein [Paenibacillus sp. HB172176]
MSNPFEEAGERYYALKNELGQYSLWPAFAGIPAGWESEYEGERDACLGYIEQNWTDMRPLAGEPRSPGL